MAIPFPHIDPIAVEIGPLLVRWYSLAYIGGFILGWASLLKLRKLYVSPPLTREHCDDLLFWSMIGVVLGGRLGYAFFYNTNYFLHNPLEVLQVWHGGMSFHGGLLGVIATVIAFSRLKKLSMLAIGDMVCAVAPIGLFLGRIANFINVELYGRVTTLPWGVIFPGTDGQPRHPSQLYEALLEGLLLYIILQLLFRRHAIRQRFGLISGIFFILYGFARCIVELVREPDAHIGVLDIGLTTGQLLSLPMIVVGIGLICYTLKQSTEEKSNR